MSRPPSRSRATRAAVIAALVPTLGLLTAFAGPDRAPVRTITITARDYAFVGPDTAVAGITTIRLLNRGKELHHVQLVRLDGGRTLADLFAALEAGGPPPAWAHDVGGPNTPVPGGESQATLELTAGRYALICFIPSPDATPHVMKGMAKELVVTAPRGARPGSGAASQAGARAPAVTMTLDDYRFTMSSPLRAGHRTIRVRNVARQSHEVLLVQLEPGKSAHDVAAWVEKQEGPPPGRPLGGTTAIAPRGWNDITVTLTPGEYALLCFIPDAKDGKPHVAHGMATQVTVR
jgi:uncharacterized cupredoxin-like copper-binding protein